MTAGKLSIGKVFVPGGMPELTYVPRTERHLETTLAEVEDNLCKLVVVTGATKTGKTVLVRKVLDTGRPIVWIDGGLASSESDFWQECLRGLNAELIVEREDGNTATRNHRVTKSGAMPPRRSWASAWLRMPNSTKVKPPLPE